MERHAYKESMLDPVAKILIVIGGVLILVGIGWQMGWIQSSRLGRLPGDIFIERGNLKIYFPFTTGLLISGILTLIGWIFRG